MTRTMYALLRSDYDWTDVLRVFESKDRADDLRERLYRRGQREAKRTGAQSVPYSFCVVSTRIAR